jgi:cell division protein FtsB
MTRVYRNSAEILAERAMSPEKPAQGGRGSESQVRPQERRLIYNGTMPPPPQVETPTGVQLPPTNRKFAKRKVSPFNVVLILIGIAASLVLYIGNVIAVNTLVNDIHKSDVRLQDILSEQEILRARINQMSSLERVRKRAEEELGLKNPASVPGWLDVDQEKTRTIEQGAGKH